MFRPPKSLPLTRVAAGGGGYRAQLATRREIVLAVVRDCKSKRKPVTATLKMGTDSLKLGLLLAFRFCGA